MLSSRSVTTHPDFVADVEEKEGTLSGKTKLKVPTLVLYSPHLGSRFDVEGIWRSLVGNDVLIQQAQVGDNQTGEYHVKLIESSLIE